MEDIEAMTKPWLESCFTPAIDLLQKIYCSEYLIWSRTRQKMLQICRFRSVWLHLVGRDVETGVWSDQRGTAWKWTPAQHQSPETTSLSSTFHWTFTFTFTLIKEGESQSGHLEHFIGLSLSLSLWSKRESLKVDTCSASATKTNPTIFNTSDHWTFTFTLTLIKEPESRHLLSIRHQNQPNPPHHPGPCHRHNPRPCHRPRHRPCRHVLILVKTWLQSLLPLVPRWGVHHQISHLVHSQEVLGLVKNLFMFLSYYGSNGKANIWPQVTRNNLDFPGRQRTKTNLTLHHYGHMVIIVIKFWSFEYWITICNWLPSTYPDSFQRWSWLVGATWTWSLQRACTNMQCQF